MNSERRQRLHKLQEAITELVEKLQELKTEAEDIRDAEQEAFDNLPEAIRDGEKGDTMYECIGCIDCVYNAIDNAVDILNDIDEDVNTATGG